VPHKELRFLLPILPVVLVVAGAGLATVRRRLSHWLPRLLTWAIPGLMTGAMVARASNITLGDVGYDQVPALSAWQASHRYNRLLWAAAERPDVCGLAVLDVGLVWLGGHSYFHSHAPMVGEKELKATADLAANYVIGRSESLRHLPSRFVPIMREGGIELWRREGGCAPPLPWFREYFPAP
jgi:hypothetical protein